MESPRSFLVSVWNLSSVLGLSLGVVLAFTVAASAFDQFHQVAAEDLYVQEVPAVTAGNQTQLVKVKDWGVQLSLPLGESSPLLRYAVEGPDSVGLSSAALEQYGPKCSAGRNAAGVLVRLAAGSDGAKLAQRRGVLKGSFGGYDYVYETPVSSCANMGQADGVAQETDMVVEGYGALSHE